MMRAIVSIARLVMLRSSWGARVNSLPINPITPHQVRRRVRYIPLTLS